MQDHPQNQATVALGINADFWKFWTGQTISNLGTSFTAFALPLLIYKLTGSALNLALASVATFLPYLLFGLVIGAWVDRLDRKRVMIGADLLNTVILASLPLLAMVDMLSLWWIYAVGFLTSTIGIAFQSAEFAAIPSLVNRADLVTANGRIQASYSAAQIIGPLLAGVLITLMPIYDLLLLDAATFLVSAVALSLIRRSFNLESTEKSAHSIRQDIVEGLRYVIGHPVLRNISLMMALVNFFGSTTQAQLVLFAQQRLGASDSQVSYLYSAGSVGIVLLSLTAGVLRKRWSFSTVALGALMLQGLLQMGFALTTTYWAALVLWALFSGLSILFNINTGSLRQAIVPNHLLGRVMTIAGVLAWSAIPLGTFLGGLAIERSGNVALVYLVIGLVTFLIPLGFAFTPLGHAERYLPAPDTTATPVVAQEAAI
ncbi:MAG: MFS transporter [Caldilineaceae bacterium]|nr:MFS transporter [Caldilineaceae bacterium]